MAKIVSTVKSDMSGHNIVNGIRTGLGLTAVGIGGAMGGEIGSLVGGFVGSHFVANTDFDKKAGAFIGVLNAVDILLERIMLPRGVIG